MTIAIELLLRTAISRIDHQKESGNVENIEVLRELIYSALILLNRGNNGRV